MANISGLFSDKRYAAVFFLVGALILAVLTINVFFIGGDEFVYSLNSNINIPLALFTTALAISLWGRVNTGWANRMLWGGLLAGWAMWTIAEVLWVVYGNLYQEIPYPSLADFFWLVGYLPMGIGLHFRAREIPARLTQSQKIGIWAGTLSTILIVVIFILVPIVQSNDPSNWLESSLNIAYPLVDLILLIMVLQLFFVYGRGAYSFGWVLLTAGFVFQPISDLVFSYANQVGIYYPDMKANLISSLFTDAFYSISYLFWILGLYTLQTSLGRYKAFGEIEQPELVPNTSILIFLNRDNTILGMDGNLQLLSSRHNGNSARLKGMLEISDDEEQSILETVLIEGKITDVPVRLSTIPGVSKIGYLSGIVTKSPAGEYTGCNLVLRVLVEKDYSLDESLTREQRFMVSHLRKSSNSSERDHIRRLLLEYHMAYLKQLYNLTLRTGGAQLGMAFFENLRKVNDDHEWYLQFNPDTLIDHADYELRLLREALPALVDESKRFVSEITDPASVEAEVEFVSSQFGEAVRRNVEFYS